MIGVVLFDNHDDLLYVFQDEEFKKKICSMSEPFDVFATSDSNSVRKEQVGEDGAVPNEKEQSFCEAQSMILMQIFSPLLTSYRIMNQQFHNSYDCIACEDGSTVAFYENMGFLVIAIAKTSIHAVHLVRVCFKIMQHVCGPSLPMLKHSPTHRELANLLIHTFLRLRKTSQPIVTESLQYEPISEALNSSIIQVLECAVEDLCERTRSSESKMHIILINQTSILAVYSGKGASELKTNEILLLVVVANAFTHAKSSTRHSLIILETCIPYTIHIQRVENGLSIIILIETGYNKFSNCISDLIRSVLSPGKNPDLIHKQIQQLRDMAKKINYRQWGESLIWRPNQSHNESAMSALVRQLRHGYEIICLNPSFLFATVEHVSDVIDNIRLSMPVKSFLQPCRLTPLLKFYPGLVHFVLVDRINHRMISPVLPVTESEDSTFNDMWKIFHTSLDWLNEGMHDLLWNDKQLCYSHSIWIEDAMNKKLVWKPSWDLHNRSLGYPGVMESNFYENLLKTGAEDEETEPTHYLQLFCIHLAISSPTHVREQTQLLANHLKRFIYSSRTRLEDLF